MEQEKKERLGQTVAFYAALAVCLTAVGVGTWELLRTRGAESGAQAGTSTVSSSLTLPGDADADTDAETSVPTASDADAAVEASADAGTAVQATDTAKAATDTGTAVKASSDTGTSAKASTDADTAVKTSADAAVPVDKKSAASTDKGASDKGASDTKAASDKSASDKSASDTKAETNKSASDKKAATDKGASDSAKPSGDAVRPLEGTIVTNYSMDKLLYNETMRDWRTHDGIDIAADPGTAVAAARAGTVESVTADPLFGTMVVIRHEDDWESVYASLTDLPEVEAGDEVSAGQVIGFVGETAACESALGAHLHFAVRKGGEAVDPETFLS